MTSPLGKHVAMVLATAALLMGCANRSAQPVQEVVIHPIPKKQGFRAGIHQIAALAVKQLQQVGRR